MKGEGPDSCAVLTATTSGHPLSGATGAMEDHPTSIQVSMKNGRNICFAALKSGKIYSFHKMQEQTKTKPT
jgi:hypothetical protein